MRYTFWILLFVLMTSVTFAQQKSSSDTSINPLQTQDSLKQKQWVDEQYARMDLDEKIGQLFIVDLFPLDNPKNMDYVEGLVKNYHVGGVIFFKGHPGMQAKLTNRYQKIAKYPLLMGIDGEWGLAMRLDSTYAFPWNMTLGAIDQDSLIRKVGEQIGHQAKRIGLQFDFAPAVDVNVNPLNPIIGNRSFGEDPKRVAQKGLAFMEGMQSAGVLTTAKHFPGHGDTDVDSHYKLPVILASRERLDSVELYPYSQMIPKGLAGVMVSHLNVPALDNRNDVPASLSKHIITNLLKNKMQFKGLVVTDALNMKGVSENKEPGQVSLEAFLAGNDILLYPLNVPDGIKRIKKAYEDGMISEERLAHSVKKILMAKYKTGLNDWQPVELEYLHENLNSPENDLLFSDLMENAITLIKNNRAVVPIRNLEKRIAYVPMGDDKGDDFYKTLNKYTQVDKIEANRLNVLLDQLKNYDEVIIGFHKSDASPWTSYKFTQEELVWIHEISIRHTTILDVFARPYALLDLRSTTNLDGILISYQNNKVSQELSAQIIFGAIGAKGRLPVSLGKEFPVGTQFLTKPLDRLAYGLPESVGMSSFMLNRIDSLAEKAIKEKMTPGMQVLVARKEKVIFQRNYGYHTYDKKLPVQDDDLYDLASMTKILATLPLVMELQEKGEISLDTRLKEILPFLKGTNKANITLKNALSHYAGIVAWLPFYRETLDENRKASAKYYRKTPSEEFSVKVTDNMYMRADYRDSIYESIAKSDLYSKVEYRYSDIIFYLLKKYLEEHYDQDLNLLTQRHFYNAMGANHLTYLPLEKFSALKITPSERDIYWRNETILGHVNDQGAAMFGNIGGHAGLFGNANDVAKMMQMFLNGGYYGGLRFLMPETIDLFNTCHFCSEGVRRGIGFDKPQSKGPGPGIPQNSRSSFGHTGFTGTVAWADPAEDLVFVCLTNRTFPDPDNRKLIQKNIRTEIEKMVYEAIILSDRQKLLAQ